MKHIKLFENFDKDYVKNSIKDLLIELQDMGMLVEVRHHVPTDVNSSREYYTISIKGVLDKTIDYGVESEVFKTFNTNLIKDYIDTTIDFMDEFCPGFEPYLFTRGGEYYDNNEKDLGESETLLINRKVLQTVLVFTKRR